GCVAERDENQRDDAAGDKDGGVRVNHHRLSPEQRFWLNTTQSATTVKTEAQRGLAAMLDAPDESTTLCIVRGALRVGKVRW
ncbi:MAG TPA: hypothetical protein VJU82_00455, partial [Acidobacteriaceae bacterium]|nr:hypothetical protein [Acidobacteriaceae bacterium]